MYVYDRERDNIFRFSVVVPKKERKYISFRNPWTTIYPGYRKATTRDSKKKLTARFRLPPLELTTIVSRYVRRSNYARMHFAEHIPCIGKHYYDHRWIQCMTDIFGMTFRESAKGE